MQLSALKNVQAHFVSAINCMAELVYRNDTINHNLLQIKTISSTIRSRRKL